MLWDAFHHRLALFFYSLSAYKFEQLKHFRVQAGAAMIEDLLPSGGGVLQGNGGDCVERSL